MNEIVSGQPRPNAVTETIRAWIVCSWRQYRLERKMFWRNPTAAFFNFLLPLIFLGLFGALFYGERAQIAVIVPGIAGMSVMSTTFSSLAFNLTFLREQGILKRIRATPLPPSAYAFSVCANAFTNTALQIAIITCSGKVLFGLDWPPDPGQLVLFSVLGGLCFASLGVALAYAIPNFDSAPAYVNAVFLPVIMISGVFYDVAHVPELIRDIATALPLVHVIDGLSAAMVSGRPVGEHVADLSILAGWTALGLFLAVRGLNRLAD